MPPVVCEGAMCACDLGDAPAALIVTSQEIVMVDGMLVATILDCAPEANLPPFGTCTELTADAQGVPTPCALAPAGTWDPGSEIQKINEIPVLTQDSVLQCSVGGTVTVTDPNNEIEQTE